MIFLLEKQINLIDLFQYLCVLVTYCLKIENGGDPFSLQRILGHTDQTTTSKYVNMARTNVKSQHSKYSPGERLG